ncbi:hypothetical protein P168DRAFT_295382 [Aspergillus campestris IBT 28561]|uniref:Rhodopsin domain-containing protein n=1 Tax=Aspergillus campestris (strain IBT 28561) TaxID=1392248 RepID=A0A2I1DCQ3_ASPC2|nr:uncharacterized protein P168DRAFT_295382 [Aspergillus campestris IBT 28561]PKY07657.1 hypothetical protein P168DRAFT_295382 [Aspergillus campestris IBT 28561]
MSSHSTSQNAAEAALHKSTVELWLLYTIGVTLTLLRTYTRVRAGGIGHLRAEDFLVWAGIIFYTAQTALAYSVGNVAHGLANNDRVIGSKIQVAGWTTYSVLIGSLKLSMLAFYIRLTEGLGYRYRGPVYVGFALVIGTMLISIITIFAACRPFYGYWQINPDPGNACQAAVSKPVVWASFASNVSTDIYLILIPIPMLWISRLKLLKKVTTTIVFGAGLFVLVCAILKSVFVLTEDPVNGAQLAGEWGTRETFAAVVTTNLPMIFHFLRPLLSRLVGSVFGTTQRTCKSPIGFYKVDCGAGEQTVHPMTANLTLSESEEHIVENVKMDDFRDSNVTGIGRERDGIVVSNQIETTYGDGDDRPSGHGRRGWEA